MHESPAASEAFSHPSKGKVLLYLGLGAIVGGAAAYGYKVLYVFPLSPLYLLWTSSRVTNILTCDLPQ